MKNLLKKIPFVLLTLSLLLVSGGTALAQDEEQEDVTLRIIEKNPEWAAFWDEVIPMFEEEYPYITIQHEAVTTGNYNQLLTARMTSNDVDLVIGEFKGQVANEVQRTQWLPLTDQPYLDSFSEDVLALGAYDDAPYLIPTGLVGNLVFYNVDIFEELELDIPTTWSEFLEVSQTIQDAGYDPVILGGADNWPVNMILNALEGPLVRAENPNFYVDLRAGDATFAEGPWVNVVERVDELSPYFQDFASGTPYDTVITLFVTETGAMMIDGSWQAGAIDNAEPEFEVGVFALPVTDDEEVNNVLTTKMATGWLINADSPNIEEAHLFLEFFSRPDVYQMFIDVSGLIPAQSDIELSGTTARTTAEFFAATPQIPVWEDIRIHGGDYSNAPNFISMILGDMTPQEVANAMQDKLIASQDNWQE